MQRPNPFRQGDRCEFLAQYILSAFAITTPVPRTEDFQGIDFHCSLLRDVNGNLQPFAPFNVQIKSSSEKSIEYGGLTGKTGQANRKWKRHEVEALRDYQTPFFIGIVDKREQRLDIFQTITRTFLKWRRLPFMVSLIPCDPTGEDRLGDGVREDVADIDPAFDCDPVEWKLPIGNPIVSIPIGDSEDDTRIEEIKRVLLEFIALDQENIVLGRAGFAHFQWPLIIRTNSALRERGIFATAPSDSMGLLRLMMPAVASLLSTYKHAKLKEEIKDWSAVIKQFPRDGHLGFMGAIIDEAFKKADEMP